jgi:hypothetical protein
MIRTLLAAAALSLMIGTAAGAAAPCKDNKGKFIKCPAPPVAPKPAATKTWTATKTTKVCKTGKPCGNTCIAKDKVCHK